MMFTTMTEEEKKFAEEKRQRKIRETNTSESSSSDSDYGSVDDDIDKTPLMKMTYSNTDDLEWDLETEKLKEYKNGCALL